MREPTPTNINSEDLIPTLDWEAELDPIHLLSYIENMLAEKSLADKQFFKRASKLTNDSYLVSAIQFLPEDKLSYAFISVFAVTREFYRRRRKNLLENSDSLLNCYIQSIYCKEHINKLISYIDHLLRLAPGQMITTINECRNINYRIRPEKTRSLLNEAYRSLIEQSEFLTKIDKKQVTNPFSMFSPEWRKEYVGDLTIQDNNCNGRPQKRYRGSY